MLTFLISPNENKQYEIVNHNVNLYYLFNHNKIYLLNNFYQIEL